MRALVLLSVLAGCTLLPGPVNPPTGDFCGAAEQNLLRLQCRIDGRILGSPNLRGETYAEVCALVEKEAQVDMRSECMAHAQDCEEVRQCNER